MLFDYRRAQADTAAGDVVPMDLSMLGEGKGQGRRRQQTRQRQRTLSSSSESIGENDRMGKKSEWSTKSCDAGTDVAHFARIQYAEDLELDMSVALSVVHMFDRLETTDVITTQMRTSLPPISRNLMDSSLETRTSVSLSSLGRCFGTSPESSARALVITAPPYRLSIHDEELHLREVRPDNEANDEEPVGEMMTATTM